jgi:transposase
MLAKTLEHGERLRLIVSPQLVERRHRKEDVAADCGRRSDGGRGDQPGCDQ